MSWKMAERLVDAVGVYLASNVAAKIAAVNADAANPVGVLTAPATWYAGEIELDLIPTHPSGFVLPVSGAMRLSNLTVGAGELRGTYSLDIGMVDTDQDTAALRRKMTRWARVLLELLVDAEDAGALGAGTTLASTGEVLVDYMPPLKKGSRMFGAVSLTVSFTTQEVRP